ncbi:glycosyltransferase family 2 protein [Siphonobacter sp. SORGH_AS_1065]|uniref:glycosyltransferase family 2 protein n=1 Tax=Siphonobacter sp. SORGH_AS_1065 TaxID=3041795 RepID=UPI00278706EA|nr:glycosyltransferase family 2 protein [Siphonobacter sp. SORGH_AS_1065]MDQ1086928.1 cellulose synthase/poly-beta-1,6-N-acetylglucosamine synthase-like glycosyltransferase [Siphonobacter sp. SORGH_AS_1065]
MIQLFLESLFWLLIFLVFYTYLGYGIFLWFLVKIRGKKKSRFNADYQPEVTLVIPAYNEMNCLAEKVQNSLTLNYPAHLLKILFVTEGSTDGSTEWLQQQYGSNERISVMGGAQRRGKIEAINLAMQQVHSPLVIYTDANTNLNPDAIPNIVRHFADAEVGAVSGEKRIQTFDNEAAAGAGEGLYWKYESFLKKLDTDLHSVVGAAGELFAIRTELYEHVEKDTLLDDFMISLRIASRGFRVVYDPEAYALERPSFSIGDEKKRKVRIAAGGFQSIARLPHLLNIFRYGWLSFQYISHRLMRWAVAPFALPLIFLINLLLALMTEGWFYPALFIAQVGFYAAAILGYYFENRKLRIKALFVPYYFSFMNWCAILGYFRYKNGLSSGIWEKVRRAQ